MENNGTDKITVEEITKSGPHIELRVWKENYIIARITLIEEKVREGEEEENKGVEFITIHLVIKYEDLEQLKLAATVIEKTLQYLKKIETDVLIFEILKIETDIDKVKSAALSIGFEKNGDEMLAIKREKYLMLAGKKEEDNLHKQVRRLSSSETGEKIFQSSIVGLQSQIKIAEALLHHEKGVFLDIIARETGISAATVGEAIRNFEDQKLLTRERDGTKKRILPDIKKICQRLNECGIGQQTNPIGQQ